MAQDWKEKGNKAFKDEDYKKAHGLYSKGIDCCPEESVELLGILFSNRAACNLEMGNKSDAMADATKAISLRPDWPRGYLRKALAYCAMNDIVNALDCALEGLKRDPNDNTLSNLSKDLTDLKNGKMPEVDDDAENAALLKEAVEKLKEAGISQSLPVTVLSGWLGAGKTTLLNRILTEDHGKKVAVIVNDMAEVNIDVELVKNATENHQVQKVKEEIVEMSNGCVCCTLRGDLIQEACRLVASQSFDHLIIESSGISEPMPVAATFTTEDMSGASLKDYFQIDNMLTVVNARQFADDLKCGD